MRKQLGLFLIGCMVAINASAAVPLVMKVSERSFQITPGSQPPKFNVDGDTATSYQNELLLFESDPKILSDLIAQIWIEDRPEWVAPSIAQAKVNLFQKRAQGLQDKYSAALAEYFNQIAQKHNAKIKVDGGSKIYVMDDGVAFFRDFYKFEGHRDPVFQAVAKAMLRGPQRTANIATPFERLAVDLHEDPRAETYLLSANDYTEQDIKGLLELSRGDTYRYEKVGNTYIFGSGFSYLLTRKLIEEGLAQRNPVLRKKFDRIVEYHEASQTPVIQSYHQGAVAYFSPGEQVMSFVLAHEADLDSYTHEMTHSRFFKFTDTLDKWTKAKGYVVPFHINGPALAGGGEHGGLYNLLNEVNSWRIGTSFDKPMTDKEILQNLKQSYGLQAGFEATEMLEKVWTPEKIKNKSVAYLVYSEIRDFNKLTNEQLITMGREGNQEGDFIKKMNFLLMLQNNRFKGTAFENDAKDIFVSMGQTKNEDSVAQLYQKLATGMGVKVPEAMKQQMSSSIDLEKASLDEVLQEFVRKGSPETTQLLLTKFVDQLGPQHIDAIVARAVQPAANPRRPEGLLLLTTVLKVQETVVNFQGSHGVTVREPIVDSPLYAALDAAVVKHVFNNQMTQAKIPLLNIINLVTRPEEMPLTFAKAVELFQPIKGKYSLDVNLAINFFRPPDGSYGKAVLWGEALMPKLGESLNNSYILKVVATFYKEAMTPYLTRMHQYGNNTFVALNPRTKSKVVNEIQGLSPAQKTSLGRASKVLWALSGSADPDVRSAALYALLSNPMYVLVNEKNLLTAEASGDPKVKEASAFLRDAASGMLQPKPFHPELTPLAVAVNAGVATMVAASCQKVLIAH